MKSIVLLCLLLSLLVSCGKDPVTPEDVVTECFNSMAQRDFGAASKLFFNAEKQLKWVEVYYEEQPVEELFGMVIDDVVTTTDAAVVVYTPERTLFNSFGTQELVILKDDGGKWRVDLKASAEFKNRINGGGLKTNLSIVGSSLAEAKKKLGRTPSTVQEIIDQLEVVGAKRSVEGYTRMYDYYPDGVSKGGKDGVIFYSKNPIGHGVYIGATSTKLFLSDGVKAFIETRISLM